MFIHFYYSRKMPFVRNEAPAVVKDGDKLKVLPVKKHYKFPKDEEMVVETPLKRKREDKIENDEYRDPKKMVNLLYYFQVYCGIL